MQNYDVIVIGGGLIGTSTAAHLANEKIKTLVVNSSSLGTPSSVAAAGLLAPFHVSEHENPKIKDFCMKGYEYFLDFYNLIKSDPTLTKVNLGFNQLGTLYLIFSISESAKIENELRNLKNPSLKYSFLNRQEVLKLEPQITKEIICGYYYPEESVINNQKFLKVLTSYCLNKKVEYINSKVLEINLVKNKIENITIDSGENLQAGTFVLCNGAWANSFLKKIFNTNEDLIKAIKGEIIQVETRHGAPLLQKIIFCKDGYILPKSPTDQFEKPSILIGSTLEEVKIESGMSIFNNTVSGTSSLTNLFKKLILDYENYYITKMWSGLRPQTSDKLPIIGKEEFENLFLCLGHFRNGILLGPLSGKIICDLIVRKQTGYDISNFNLGRLLKVLC